MADKNKRTMSDETIKQFYREIGDVCNKYKIQGVAGIWLGPGEEHGQMIFHNVNDSRTKQVVYAVAELWESFLAHNNVPKGRQLGVIHESRSSDPHEN